VETLNRHSFLYGHDWTRKSGRTIRGQRVYCSERGRRGGCGHTFNIVFAWVLPRHSYTTFLLWDLLEKLCDGLSISAAWESCRLRMSLESAYHLVRRLRARLPDVRTRLLRRIRPPPSLQSDPLRQSVEHLRDAGNGAPEPIAAFQQRFQTPLMG